MRDSKQIRANCNAIASNWETVPEIRLGQLMYITFNHIEKDGIDPFFIGDKEFLKYLDEAVKGMVIIRNA